MKCKLEKSISDFNKNKSKKDGLSNWCKSCKYISKKNVKDKDIEFYSKRNKEYKLKNKNILKEQNKEYTLKNKDKIKEYQKEYRKIHKSVYKYREPTEESRNRKNEWVKNDRKNRPWYYSHRDLLNRIVKQIKYNKMSSTIVELGYNSLELKEHIEKLFIEGMTWDNRQEWYIDHIIPISSFDSDTPANIVNALSNLQPLWKKDNLVKYNK